MSSPTQPTPPSPPSPPPSPFSLFRAAASVFGFFLDRPMRYFYVHGYWRGLAESNICASLSNYDSEFWRLNTLACNEIIQRHVHSFNVYILTAVYFALLGHVLYTIVDGTCVALWRRGFSLATRGLDRKRATPLDAAGDSPLNTTQGLP